MRMVIRLSKTIDINMKDVCELSFQDELKKINDLDNNNIIYESLTKEEINRLAKKIELLPFEYRNILFFRYCFNSTPFETDKILKIENSKNKLFYIQKMLSNLMGIENSCIDNNSMEEACHIALSANKKHLFLFLMILFYLMLIPKHLKDLGFSIIHPVKYKLIFN